MQIGTMVRVIDSVDPACPIDQKFFRKVGVVKDVNDDRPSPITVDFGKLGRDSFWLDELEKI